MVTKTLATILIMLAASIAQTGDWKGRELVLMENANIQEMHKAQTEHRKRNGLKAQKLNGSLCRAAQEWSEYMAKRGYFYHSHYQVAENIAMGYRSGRACINGWISSGGHNANLLSGSRQVGFGVAEAADGTRYWTSCHGSGFKVHKNSTLPKFSASSTPQRPSPAKSSDQRP